MALDNDGLPKSSDHDLAKLPQMLIGSRWYHRLGCRIGIHAWEGCHCARQNCTGRRNSHHNWGPWNSESPQLLTPFRNCIRCGCLDVADGDFPFGCPGCVLDGRFRAKPGKCILTANSDGTWSLGCSTCGDHCSVTGSLKHEVLFYPHIR